MLPSTEQNGSAPVRYAWQARLPDGTIVQGEVEECDPPPGISGPKHLLRKSAACAKVLAELDRVAGVGVVNEFQMSPADQI